MRHACLPLITLLALGACTSPSGTSGENSGEVQPTEPTFAIEAFESFDEPWAMAFRPGTETLFITEQGGAVRSYDTRTGRLGSIASGIPDVDYGGQGGLGDIAFHPEADAQDPPMLYLTWVEAGPGGTRGAALGRGLLTCDQAGSCELRDFETLWRQDKTTGRGHFGHRIAFSPDGQYIFLSSGERQKFDPAQDLTNNMGAILRLELDGSAAEGNPFFDRGGSAAEIWSYGHRNPLGLAFAPDGRLWQHEMGPKAGDEVNLIERGKNYGYPLVSNGDHYNGDDIPDHAPGDGFEAPDVYWYPVTSAPSGLIVYSGDLFPEWTGSLLLGGLASRALMRVEPTGDTARKADHWEMGERIREVEQGPDGAVWVLEDGDGGRLLRLTPGG